MDKLRIVFDWFPNTIHAGVLAAKKPDLMWRLKDRFIMSWILLRQI